MTAPTTTAATPEELAAQMRSYADNPAACYVPIHQVTLTEWARWIEVQAQHSEAQRAEIERLTADLDYANNDRHDINLSRLEWKARATTAEAALADLIALTGQTDAAKAVAVVATMLAGADHGSYGSVVREYAECKAALAAVTAERDRMREAPRYMDEIEAGRVAWSWIEDIVRRDGLKAPHTTIKTDRLKGDGGTVELWHKDRLVAVALVLRDCWNWSVLARMEFSGREEPSSAALSAKEATDER